MRFQCKRGSEYNLESTVDIESLRAINNNNNNNNNKKVRVISFKIFPRINAVGLLLTGLYTMRLVTFGKV
jgi:hypothetical protein